MKFPFTTLIIIVLSNILGLSQTIQSPTYTRADNVSLSISAITRTNDYTIIQGMYTNVFKYGWACLNNDAYIRDCKTGEKYTVIKSEGLPLSPSHHNFSQGQEKVNFTFYFPPINDEVEMIDMIENESSHTAFNIYGIALNDNVERNFDIKINPGNVFNSKPSLQNRINGVKEIQLYVPHSMGQLEEFIYGNIIDYLHKLGLKVDVVRTQFETTKEQVNTVVAYHTLFNGKVSNYLKNANTLCMVVNYTQAAGQYVSGTTLHITFVDYANGYTWHLQNITLPNRYDKLIRALKRDITNSYKYNPSFAFVPPTTETTWNHRIAKADLDKNGGDQIEGIYQGDKYTLGVKKHPTTGEYYILYFDGADNLEDWRDGDVKCELLSTATPYIFKGSWYGKWKQYDLYNIYFSSTGFVVDYGDGEKDTYIKMYPTTQSISENSASSGSGFLLSSDGYIITNHHVIENAKDGSIKVTGINDDYNKSYMAQVEISDKQNDLAILKIIDPTFSHLHNIPYSFKFTTSSVGEDCFVLGYPLISSMGKDIKLTTGVISSKTGFEGNIAQYQISAPVQPGNSGGPLFDKNGYIIGIVQAKHTQAENAGYAIKASYIRNLVELLPSSVKFPEVNLLNGKTLPKQVELASKAVCLIIVNDK